MPKKFVFNVKIGSDLYLGGLAGQAKLYIISTLYCVFIFSQISPSMN